MLRHVMVACWLLALSGCAEPELATMRVRAKSAEELAGFRADLARHSAPAQLAAFETALHELQLAGIDRGLGSTVERAAAMRAAVDNKTVREVEILGWQARRSRLLGEIEQLSVTLDADLRTRERQGTAISPTVVNRIQNLEDIIERLRRNLADAERQLTTWGAPVR